MLAVQICEDFGWSYDTFLDQPTWFIDLIIEKKQIDAKRAKEEARKRP